MHTAPSEARRLCYTVNVFGNKDSFELFLDVSSSSVTLALVSKENNDYETIWHHKERFVVLEDTSDAMYFKKISTALLQCFLELETNGFSKMPSGRGKAVKNFRVIVGAPWSYTIVRKNTFKRDEPFQLTERFVKKLEAETDEQVMDDLKKGAVKLEAGLQLLNSQTIATTANGYRTQKLFDKEVSVLEFVRLLGLYDKQIITLIDELAKKNIPSAEIFTVTNMQVLQSFIEKTLFLPEVLVCDTSGEVIETAIIDRNELKQVSYIVTGLHALVRDISSLTSVESTHVLAALKGDSSGFETQYPLHAKNLKTVFKKHSEIIAAGISSLATKNAIPQHLFIRTEPGYEALFTHLFELALQQFDHQEYSIHVFTPKLFKRDKVSEAKTNIAAFVFHNF